MQQTPEMSDLETQQDERKTYAKPEIVHELELESQAGSILEIGPSLLDLFDQ